MPAGTACLGLLCRRQCPVPTLRGWALLIPGAVVVAVLAVRGIYPFLAVTDSQPGGVLVVEGECADGALKEAIAEFHLHHYGALYSVGGPLLTGAALSDYPTYAVQGAARLVQLGVAANDVQAVPATRARRDATYHEAVCLAKWLREHGTRPTMVNVLAEGPAARRTRLMFEKALGSGVRVGVIALAPQDYDPDRWWRSSEGVRTVTGEALGYWYARLFITGTKE